MIFDPKTSGFSIGRQYPQRSEDMETFAKDLLVNKIKEALGVKSFSYATSDFDSLIEDKNSMHYNDFLRSGERKYLVFPSNTSVTPSFMVGSIVVCPYCGRGITSAGPACSHESCRQ